MKGESAMPEISLWSRSILMRAVLENVRAQGLKVVPACPFVADFIDRHPEFADLLG